MESFNLDDFFKLHRQLCTLKNYVIYYHDNGEHISSETKEAYVLAHNKFMEFEEKVNSDKFPKSLESVVERPMLLLIEYKNILNELFVALNNLYPQLPQTKDVLTKFSHVRDALKYEMGDYSFKTKEFEAENSFLNAQKKQTKDVKQGIQNYEILNPIWCFMDYLDSFWVRKSELSNSTRTIIMRAYNWSLEHEKFKINFSEPITRISSLSPRIALEIRQKVQEYFIQRLFYDYNGEKNHWTAGKQREFYLDVLSLIDLCYFIAGDKSYDLNILVNDMLRNLVWLVSSPDSLTVNSFRIIISKISYTIGNDSYKDNIFVNEAINLCTTILNSSYIKSPKLGKIN